MTRLQESRGEQSAIRLLPRFPVVSQCSFLRPNAPVNVAAARNRCFQFRRDPPLTFNRWFGQVLGDGPDRTAQFRRHFAQGEACCQMSLREASHR